MAVNTALRDYLLTRRSVGLGFLNEPGPSQAELDTILTIATRVPDHGKITPWRLMVYAGEARALVGERLAEIARKRFPTYDDASLDVERKRFLPAPLTIGVISRPQEHPKVPELEQVLSAGNVAFNLIHAAHAHGYAASWITRWFAFDQEAASMLGAKEGEQFVGFVHIGTPSVTPEERPRPDLTSVVSYYEG
ncbi:MULTISPECIES: nitroreductase [unclassified Devosia]|uniref:nitroreductase family protein n=1 Tax=unclassified Devosia TaxID=196773 RepID=UPI00145CBA4C|nr:MULTISPECIES: nitroreductase [unclassified Devosia]MBK1793556.1 nitroreductase [Devosia sp. WQ 349K1]